MKTAKKIKRANKYLQSLIKKNIKNYKKFFEQMTKLFKLACVIVFTFIYTCMTSCNVTRKVTTEATYYQKGDTTTTIVTKTTETYDAKKNLQ